MNFIGTCSSFVFNGNSFYDWIGDLGASEHITPHEHLLTNKIRLKIPIHVKLLDGRVASIHVIGNIRLYHHPYLINVLFVPTFQVNLLSISKLLHQKPLQVVFSSTTSVLRDKKSKMVIAKVDSHNGLYVLKCMQSFDLLSFLSDFMSKPVIGIPMH